MTAVVQAGAKQSDWKEYKNADGRAYWSHAVTKQSVWEKPEELQTPFEKAMAKTNWKQYTTKDRPYYVNSFTKETVWALPPDLVELQKKVDAEEEEKERRRAAGEASPLPASRSPSPAPSPSPEPEYLRAPADQPSTALTRYAPPSRSPSPAPAPARVITLPPGGFRNLEDAEEGFMYLLKREGIDDKWTWDQTMRKIVLDPLYKALDTLAHKKAAFEKYVRQLVEERQVQRDARIAKLRPVLVRLFQQSGAVKSYSTMKTAEAAFGEERAWADAEPDERRLIFEDYVRGLRAAEETAERELRARNADVLAALVRRLDVTVSTRWRAAHDLIVSSDDFRADAKLRQMETADMLRVYEDYAVALEREHDDDARRRRAEQVRRARKAREGFRALLAELAAEGALNRKSKWKDMYGRIKDDERYSALLGIPGSSPLDLWMDAVDDLQEECERAVDKIQAALRERGKTIGIDTKEEEFEALVQDAGLVTQIDEKARHDAYDMAAADEQRRAERKRRHRIDDLRYALRKVRDLNVDGSYEDALPLIKDLPEFRDITDDDDRKTAFEKFARRQKEKMREAEGSDAGSAHRERERDRAGARDGGARDGDRRERERGGDGDRDRERERERERDRDRNRRDSYSRPGRERGHRDDEAKDRADRARDRDRDREREREPERERDPARERDRRSRDRDVDDRDAKRRRLSATSHDLEEGEI